MAYVKALTDKRLHLNAGMYRTFVNVMALLRVIVPACVTLIEVAFERWTGLGDAIGLTESKSFRSHIWLVALVSTIQTPLLASIKFKLDD